MAATALSGVIRGAGRDHSCQGSLAGTQCELAGGGNRNSLHATELLRPGLVLGACDLSGSQHREQPPQRWRLVMLLLIMFALFGFAYSYWISSMRANRPPHAEPQSGFVYPIQEKATYYVTEFEYYSLNFLLWGNFLCFASLGALALFHAAAKKPK